MNYIPLPGGHPQAWTLCPELIRYDFARQLMRQAFGYCDTCKLDNLEVRGPGYFIRVTSGGVSVELAELNYEADAYGVRRLSRSNPNPDAYALYTKAIPAFTVLAGIAHPPTYWRQPTELSETRTPGVCSAGGEHACQ